MVPAEDEAAAAGYVVFGATGGVGSALCRQLVAAGGRVLAVGRNPDKLAVLGAELGISTFCADVTSAAAVDAAIDEAVTVLPRLDGVAHCVGSLLLKPAHLTSDAEWDQTVATNLNSAFYVLRAAVRTMQTRGGGSIVLVSTAAAATGLANHEAIGAAKAGVEGLMLAAAATYGPRGIRANCVAPGLVRTPLTARLTENELSLKASVAMHALGRIGEPSDIANAIEWLLSPAQSWVTGQVIGVDGGLARLRVRGK